MPLPRQLVGHGELFMLRVAGDSMVDAAICDGDWVVVRRQSDAVNGDIVAALLDDEATVKTFRQRDGHTWLLPQNTQYEPILGDHAVIMGKVVSRPPLAVSPARGSVSPGQLFARLACVSACAPAEPFQRRHGGLPVCRRPERRQCSPQESAVALRGQPGVQHGHHALVRSWSGSAVPPPGPAGWRRGWRTRT